MKKLLTVLTAGMFLMGMATSASATKMLYTASGGPTTFTLNYTVENDTLPDSIQWLSVYFGQTSDGLNFANTQLFSNFVPDDTGVSAPSGWFSYSFEPTAIDNPGIYNSDALGSGIAPGSSFGGFKVTFDMQSGATYDHLFFLVGNFDQTGGYNTLDNGYTQASQQPPGVPEPSTLLLLGAGLGGLAIFRRKRG